MSVDDVSAQDSALIDEDLVEALGFEPVGAATTAVEAEPASDDSSTSDESVADDEDAPSDEAVVADESDDIADTADEVVSEDSDLDSELEDLVAAAAVLDADGSEVDAEAMELLDSHREPASLLDTDDVELFDDKALDESVSLDDGSNPTEMVSEPLVADLDGSDLADPYADYGANPPLATPESVFADVPTSPPGLTDTAAIATAAAVPAAVAAVPASKRRVRRKKKLRARKSRRVIRHIDPWSVLTFSVIFHMFLFAALLLASVLVWNAAIASGMIENVESFIQELGDYETFEINADVMFKAAVISAGMLTLASSVMVVLLTVVFNLISDLVGGVRVTVIEEETVRVPVKKRKKSE